MKITLMEVNKNNKMLKVKITPEFKAARIAT